MTAYILVPLDGSALAESALPLDIALARMTSSGIILLTAVPATANDDPRFGTIFSTGTLGSMNREELSAARDYLDNVGKQVEKYDVPVRTEILEDALATAIVEYANQNSDIWLIAMTTRHSSPGPWASGSVAERVLHRTHKPVVLIRPTSAHTGEYMSAEPNFNTIVVPLDGSRLGEVALDQARVMALDTDATLLLVSVVPPVGNGNIDQVEYIPISADLSRRNEEARLAHYLAKIATSLRAEGLQVRTELVFGHTAEMILLTARRLHGDLIVIASRGRRDLERAWLGRITQKLVQSSSLPVLLIRVPGHQVETDEVRDQRSTGFLTAHSLTVIADN